MDGELIDSVDTSHYSIVTDINGLRIYLPYVDSDGWEELVMRTIQKLPNIRRIVDLSTYPLLYCSFLLSDKIPPLYPHLYSTYSKYDVPINQTNKYDSIFNGIVMRDISGILSDSKHKVKFVSIYGLSNQMYLSGINFSECERVYFGGFSRCVSIETVELPKCTYIGPIAFDYNSNLTSVYLPSAEIINHSAFRGCRKLTTVSAPKCKYFPGRVFNNIGIYGGEGYIRCSLSEKVFPECVIYDDLDPLDCSIIDMPKCQYIHNEFYAEGYGYVNVSAIISSGNFSNVTSINMPELLDCSYIHYIMSNTSICSYVNLGADPFSFTLMYHNTLYSTYRDNPILFSYILYPSIMDEIDTDNLTLNCAFIGGFRNNNLVETLYLPECYGYIDNEEVAELYTAYNSSNYGSTYVFPATEAGSPFCNCENLKTIILPKCSSITGFNSCPNLERVYLPECTYIDGFNNCPKLKHVTAGKCNYVGGFNNCTNLETIELPNCISVLTNAFSGCEHLVHPLLPECLFIGESAFNNCYALTDLTFEKCLFISNSAFTGCTGLNTLTLPKCYHIATSALSVCATLNLPHYTKIAWSSIIVTSKEREYAMEMSGASTFWASVEKSVYEYPGGPLLRPKRDDYTEITDATFQQFCANLSSSVTLDLNKTVITNVMTYYNIENINVNIIYAGSGFGTFSRLSYVTLPACRRVRYAFSECNSLAVANLPACIEISSCFNRCIALHDISLPNCIDVNGGFNNCSALTNVVLPNCKSIVNAFNNCINLENIELPLCEYVNGGFVSTPIKVIELPQCKLISGNAFENCTELERVYLPECECIIDDYGHSLFKNCPKLSYLYAPKCGYFGAVISGTCISELSFPELKYYYGNIANGLIQSINFPKCVGFQTSYALSDASYWRNLQVLSLPNCISVNTGLLTMSDYECTGSITKLYLPAITVMRNYFSFTTFNGSIITSDFFPNCRILQGAALRNCQNLKEVYMNECLYIAGSGRSSQYTGNGYTTGGSPFGGCRQLNRIHFPKCYAIMKAFNELPITKIEEYDLPSCVRISSAFINCSVLSEVYLPNAVSIYNAFSRCSNLTSFIAPKCASIRECFNWCGFSIIDSEYFSNCMKFKSCFNSCSNLTEIHLPNCYNLYSCFNNCSNISVVDIPKIVYISQCFNSCDFSVINPSTFITDFEFIIDSGTFCNCQNLKEIDMPNCVAISDSAFLNCPNVEKMVLDDYTLGIHGYSLFKFSQFTKLSYVKLPLIPVISGNLGFMSLSLLKSVYAATCSEIKFSAFNECGLEIIKSDFFPRCLNIRGAFKNCSLLEEIHFPMVNWLEEAAFKGCTNLKLIDMPMLSSIQYTGAFQGCSKLSAIITRYNSIVNMSMYTSLFTNNPNLILYVPSTAISLYSAHSIYSSYMSRIMPIQD
ncbi:leucine-rich repeat protein [Pseudobutyrivibrio sp.]